MLQDQGCNKCELKKRICKQSKIPVCGPPKASIYYYELISIAIDYVKKFKKEHKLGKGWNKMPDNTTDTKVKIIKRLLAI